VSHPSITADAAVTAAAFVLARARRRYQKWADSSEGNPDGITDQLAQWADGIDAEIEALQGLALPRTIYQRTASVSTSVDATPVTLGTVTIPGGSLGLGGHVRGKFAGGLTVATGGGDTMTFTLELGGAAAAEIVVTDTDLSIASHRFEVEFEFANVSTTSLQVGSLKVTLATADGVPAASAVGLIAIVGAIDSTADMLLELIATGSDVSDMSASCTYGNISLAAAP
jgi:hypothetical protein